MTAAVHTVFVSKPKPAPPPRRSNELAGAPEPVNVNGVVIEPSAIAQEMQHHPAAKPAEAWHAAVRALIVRELLSQRAAAIGIEPEPLTDSAGRRETKEEALIRALIEREVKTPEPDEETCRRYYRQNRARFRSPHIYEASHILFAARRDDAATFQRAAVEAASVLEELKAKPERFAELARHYSDCPSAAQGGNLGQITPDQVTPEFAKALSGLAPGDMASSPVETRYGLHIVRLDRSIAAREFPFELVAGRVADYLRETVTRRATAQYIARLVSAAKMSGVDLQSAEARNTRAATA